MKIFNRNKLYIKAFFTFIAPIILYWQDLTLIFNEALKSDILTHIIAVPFLVTYILYRRRFILAASISSTLLIKRKILPVKEVLGILLCLLAYFITWFGSYTFLPLEYHIASLPLFVAGIIIIIFNVRTLRSLFFPLVFLAFLIPPPLKLVRAIGSTLAIFSAQAAFNILKTLGLPVVLITQYGSPIIYLTTQSEITINFTVDIACSGIYSLIGFTLFVVFVAYISNGSISKKIAIFVLGIPIIYALNILRVSLLILIGYYSGPELALNIFHVFGGWILILVGTTIVLIISEKIFKVQFFGKKLEKCSHPENDEAEYFCLRCGKILKLHNFNIEKIDGIKILSILVVTALLSHIQVPVFVLTRGSTQISSTFNFGEATTTMIIPEYEGYSPRFVYRDTAFENVSGQDASLLYQYLPKNRSRPIIWVGLEIGSVKSCLHPWEECLILHHERLGQEVDVIQLDLRDIHLLKNPPLSARYFAFQRKGTDNAQIILYWYIRLIFKTDNGYQLKWVKISFIEYTQNPNEYRIIEDELLPLAYNLANYWQPIKTWSLIARTIAENSVIYILIITTLMASTVIFWIYLELKKRKKARRIYDQISDPEDRQILDAVKILEKELAIESSIASKYKDMTCKDIDIKRLHIKLIKAEEIGLVEKKIINRNDEPYISWTPMF